MGKRKTPRPPSPEGIAGAQLDFLRKLVGFSREQPEVQQFLAERGRLGEAVFSRLPGAAPVGVSIEGGPAQFSGLPGAAPAEELGGGDLIAALRRQAVTGLAEPGRLPEDVETQLTQRIRASQAARGVALSPGSAVQEAAGLLGGSEAFRARRLAQASGILGATETAEAGRLAQAQAFLGISPLPLLSQAPTFGEIGRQAQAGFESVARAQRAAGAGFATLGGLIGGGLGTLGGPLGFAGGEAFGSAAGTLLGGLF